jgi:hypothetical protein
VTLDAVRHAIEAEDKGALMDSLIIGRFLRRVLIDFHADRGTCCGTSQAGT